MTDISNNIALVIGEPGNLKTSLLFHYGYLILDHLGNSGSIKSENEELVHGVVLCNQNKMEQNSFYFGKYSEVFIGTLKQLKLKYVKSFEEIIYFLTYFRFIEHKPSFVFIDEPSSLLSDAGDLKLSKLSYLYSLIKETSKFVPSTSEKYFKVIVVEPIKGKELENNSKDKENMSVFQKYFKNLLAVKKDDSRKEFFLKRLVYNTEGDENSQYIQTVNYSDMFLERILKDVNDGLLSAEMGQ